jgi:hypothetical protein
VVTTVLAACGTFSLGDPLLAASTPKEVTVIFHFSVFVDNLVMSTKQAEISAFLLLLLIAFSATGGAVVTLNPVIDYTTGNGYQWSWLEGDVSAYVITPPFPVFNVPTQNVKLPSAYGASAAVDPDTYQVYIFGGRRMFLFFSLLQTSYLIYFQRIIIILYFVII